MGKSVLLRRSAMLVLAGIVLASIITATLYMGYTRSFYAQTKADELLLRANTISQWAASYWSGQLPLRSFRQVVGNNSAAWGAQVVIYDKSGKLFLWTQSADPSTSPYPEQALSQSPSPLGRELEMVLEGQSVRTLPLRFGLPAAGQNLIVGVPVQVPGTVVGAVLLIKPMQEIDHAISAINVRLVLIILGVCVMMLIPTLLATRQLVRPLGRMRDAALKMAEGDFSIAANEREKGEIGQMGWALNHLSNSLYASITALELERNRLSHILTGLRDGIIALDAQGRITHYNPALLHLLGKQPGFIPATREQLWPDSDLWQAFEQVNEQGIVVEREICRGERILHVSITPLHDDQGHGAGAVGMVQDTTEAVHLEQTRRDYVANVSHELKTPLSSMRGLVETLQDGLISGEEDRQRYYGYILRECMRLTRLINDLLELSRLQSGQLALERRAFDMTCLIQEVAWRFVPRAEDVGLDFTLNLPQNCPSAFSNPDRVEQVLVILLDNAIKYTQEGSVQLSAAWDEKHILLTVRDTGQGITPQDAEHIFERFYKADKAHSESGTGLGLSIAREVLGQLGETITVDTHLGEGTAFTFTVKRADAMGQEVLMD